MPHRAAARKVKSGWTKANEWLRFHPLPAYLLVVIVAAWATGTAYEAGKDGQDAANQAQVAIRKSDGERDARVKISGELQRYVCRENNKQDQILAGLIDVSLGDQSSFGAGIDRSDLDPFTLDVLNSITALQEKVAAGQADSFRAAFLGAQAQLRRRTPCNVLVEAFTEASDTRDYQAVRRLLAALDRRDREVAKEAAEAP